MEWDKQTHKDLCEELHQTYLAKNKDYGNSFSEQVQEYGQVVALIRIEEKFKRFKQLVLTEEQEVKDEKAFDTLLDMANYCLLSAMEYLRDADTTDNEEDKVQMKPVTVNPKRDIDVIGYNELHQQTILHLSVTSTLTVLNISDFNVEMSYKGTNDNYYKVNFDKDSFDEYFEEV